MDILLYCYVSNKFITIEIDIFENEKLNLNLNSWDEKRTKVQKIIDL